MKRITKRIKECAIGIVHQGYAHDHFYLQETVLDENDEPYTYAEYLSAVVWIQKRLGM